MPPSKPRPKRRRRRSDRVLKDRLIQTRVPEDLESALKDAASKRRLSVSHLIRNVLEDTFHLVDNVITEVDHIVQDSVGLARQVRKDASRIGDAARRDEAPTPAPTQATPATAPTQAAPATPTTPSLDHVLAWNKVVLNRDAVCAKCGKALAKGAEGHLGLAQEPGHPPAWLCSACL
jgi:hypothetical protein